MIVSELWVYPVKACRGIQAAAAALTPAGLAFDRRVLAPLERGAAASDRSFCPAASLNSPPRLANRRRRRRRRAVPTAAAAAMNATGSGASCAPTAAASTGSASSLRWR